MTLPKQDEVHCHRTQRYAVVDRRKDDPCIGAVKCCRRHETEQEPPAIAPDREPPVLDEEAIEDIPVALQELRAQLEQLDFLDAIFARDDRLEVHLHACIRRAPAKQAECIA